MPNNLAGLIQAELSHLDSKGQQKVLAFVRSINASQPTNSLPPGTPDGELVKAAQGLTFSEEDLRQMADAIEEDCEQVNPSEW